MTPTVRRAIAAFLGGAVPFIAALIKAKTGVDIPTETIIGAQAIAGAYVAQSALREAHETAVTATQALPTSPVAVAADLSKGATP